MNKVIAGVTAAGILSLSLLSAVPANAEPAGKVTICHATGSADNPYNVITVSKNSVDKGTGHGAHEGDIIPATPECIALDTTPDPEIDPDEEGPVDEPVKPADPGHAITNHVHNISYQCDVPYPTRTDYISFYRAIPTYDAASNTWVYGTPVFEESTTTFFLDEEGVLTYCAPTPGDKPVGPEVPANPTPEVPATPVNPVPEVLATPVAPEASVADVPVANTTPVQPEQQGKLADTGVKEDLTILGGIAALIIAGGVALTRLGRKVS